jgi:hypothetical protein
MTRHRHHNQVSRYEDLTEGEVERARSEIHQGERARGQSYETEEPKSWIGRKARALKERFKGKEATKTKEPGRIAKAKEWVSREVTGGFKEAKEELGLDEAMEARAAGKVKKIKGMARRIQAGAKKRTAHTGRASSMPAFMQGMSTPGPMTELISARSVARPQGPHFMQSVTQGSGGRKRATIQNPMASVFGGGKGPRGGGAIRNPAAMMGWGSPGSRQPPKKKRAPRMKPGQVTIIIGGRAPSKRKAGAKASKGRPVGLRW